jgi:Hypothetical glycosyl hydrolase family 15
MQEETERTKVTLRAVLIVMIWMSLLICGRVSAFTKPPFPRLGANWIANQNYQQPKIQAQLARGSIALIQVWPGWEKGRGATLQQVIRQIKALNPNTLVFQYIKNNEIDTNRANYAPFAPLYAKLDAMSWYLYVNGGCCALVKSTWPGAVVLNNSLFAPPDASGQRWVDWYARWAVEQFYSPNPALDGFNTDNVFWKPRVNGDWNRDGITDSSGDPVVGKWHREGYVRHFELLKQLMPGKLQIGNVADWGHPDAVLDEYQGLLDGGVMEGLIGNTWSVETWGGWRAMMAWYRKTMAALAEPKLGIFHQVGTESDYQGMRYGLASALMDEAYYVYNTAADGGGNAPWFDEYQVPLGEETSPPPTAAWQKGVYRRDFQNGIALVNPKGNGAQTITLETEFRRLSGNQAPTINSGQTVRTLTLQDRDGIILLRLNPVSAAKGRATGRSSVARSARIGAAS